MRNRRIGPFVVLVVLAALMTPAVPARADIGVSGTLGLTATTVTVDAAGHAGALTVRNTNTPPHNTLNNTVTALRLGLGCGAPGSADNLCPSPDTGVITVGTAATGDTGTACAGRAFTISAPDANNIVTLTVQGTPVVLGAPGLPGGGDQCRVVFPVHFQKVPTIDANPGAAGAQSRFNGHGQLTNSGTVVNSFPSLEVTINPAAGGNGVADFNGDGSSDRAVYRSGAWLVHNQNSVFHGLSGDIPVPADYDGNGTTDRVVFRDGAWFTHAKPTVFFGLAGDLPVPADYDGDGKVDRAVFRNGAWFVEGQPTVHFGLPGDIPVPADYHGDAKAERAVFREGVWHIQGLPAVQFGLAGDIPVPADYNADHKAERAVYRNGVWYREGRLPATWGLAGDVPVPADYNNDNFVDMAVYRNGTWHVVGFSTVNYGLAGDIPLALPAAVYRTFFSGP